MSNIPQLQLHGKQLDTFKLGKKSKTLFKLLHITGLTSIQYAAGYFQSQRLQYLQNNYSYEL